MTERMQRLLNLLRRFRARTAVSAHVLRQLALIDTRHPRQASQRQQTLIVAKNDGTS